MSLFGSLFTGVSALSAQSQAMGMISNNIANVNTTGYKRNEASFSSLVTQAGRSTIYSPGGVRASTEQTVNQQGTPQQTASSTDVAISGSGFFVVQQSPTSSSGQETMYTRAGSFSEDENGYLRNSNGFYLMGWEVGDDGALVNATADVASLTPVSVGFESGRTKQTTQADVVLNLDARQSTVATGPHFSRSMTVYDSLGAAQQLQMDFTNDGSATNPNTWNFAISDPDGGVITSPTAATNLQLVFGSNGKIDKTATQAANSTYMAFSPAGDPTGDLKLSLTGIDWANNSDATQDITIDITGLTQSASDYSVGTINQDGAELGLRTGIAIDTDGNVVASFSNGLTQNLARDSDRHLHEPQRPSGAYRQRLYPDQRQRRLQPSRCGNSRSGQYRHILAGSLQRRSGRRVLPHDHHPARLLGRHQDHQHHRPDADRTAGTALTGSAYPTPAG